MGTKKTTETTRKFDPQSMGRYQGWQGFLFPKLQSLFADPFTNPFFQLNQQFQAKAASALAGRNMQNALLNFMRSGIPLTSGAATSALNQLGRYGSSLQFQGLQNAVNQAQVDRWNAASLGSSLFQPLETGQTTVQKTSGLGTWLPQVLTAGAAIATAPFTGGVSLDALRKNIGGAGNYLGAPNFSNLNALNPGFWNPTSLPPGQSGLGG
jgi:hypothetical protein